MAEDEKSLSSRRVRRDPYRLTGETFSGRYRLEEFTGMGSFGAVYRTTDTRVGRTVAVKILKPDLGDDETDVARELFQREASTAGRLLHPHIVAVTDVGEESGFAYLVMEWLEGRTLEDELRTRVAFSPAEVASLLAPISDALQTAHDAGVIHRDIKPSNIYIGRRERPFVKVLDFGIAKVVTSPTAATASRIAGTGSYMSPEQITGSRIDRRSDIYSLGIVLYQMLTGELPFKGDSQGQIIQQHIAAAPPSLAEARPDLPQALSQVVQRALGKLPEARQQSAHELYSEFNAALASQPAPQPSHRNVPSYEQATEVIQHDIPPTVWAGQPIAPQPSPDRALPTIPVRGITSESPPPPMFPPASRKIAPARLAQPYQLNNRGWAAILSFGIAGASIFVLLAVLTLVVAFGRLYGLIHPDFVPYTLTGSASFGLLFGVTVSPLRWSKRALYYALSGAAALLILSVYPRLRLYSAPGSPRFFLILLHNMLAGAAIGVAVCAVGLSVRIDERVKAFLISGAGCAIIVMVLDYLYYLSMLLYGIGISHGDYARDVMSWLGHAAIGFGIGMIICALRFGFRKSVR